MWQDAELDEEDDDKEEMEWPSPLPILDSSLELAAEADDEGTVSLMSDYISETEKTLWMLNSYIK